MSHHHKHFRLICPLYRSQVVLISLKVNPSLVLILLGALMHVLPDFVCTLSTSVWVVLCLSVEPICSLAIIGNFLFPAIEEAALTPSVSSDSTVVVLVFYLFHIPSFNGFFALASKALA